MMIKLGGFGFEMQLSLTEKGRYAVAYGLSCKKDCHGLHTTDPRRTIPYPIPVTPLHHIILGRKGWMKTPTDSSGNISSNKPISETSVIGRYAGLKMSWTTGREKHLATKRQVFYSWICSNHRYPSVALEIRIQGRPNLFQITNRYPRPPTRAHDRRVSQEPAQPLLCFCDKYELKKA